MIEIWTGIALAFLMGYFTGRQVDKMERRFIKRMIEIADDIERKRNDP